MKLEIKYKKNTAKNTNTWRLNNILLNNQWVTEEIKEAIKKTPGDKGKWKHNNPKSMGLSKSNSRREVITIQAHLRKQEKSQINKLTLHLNVLDEEEQTKPKVNRMKEIIKFRLEVSEIET